MKLNSIQVNKMNFDIDYSSLTLNPLYINEEYENIKVKYSNIFKQKNQKTFSFTKDGFFSLIMQLEGKIAVSTGECEHIINGAKLASKYRNDITILKINTDGTLDIRKLDNNEFKFLFISSYIMDTYVKIDLKKIREKTNGKIISNILENLSNQYSDILLLDSFKLCSYGGTGVILYDDEFENQNLSEINLITLEQCFKAINKKKINIDIKDKFIKILKSFFKDDLIFFVNPNICLNNTLHIGIKNIKTSELIRTLNLNNIFITNGESCTLGLMKPSRIIKEMSYDEKISTWCISLSFDMNYSDDEITKVVQLINKKYRQIKALK
jgi:hypothetical protein